MHPDRKWPSMAVCLLILSAVLYIGVSTNNSLSSAARKTFAENMQRIKASNSTAQNNSSDERVALVNALNRAAGNDVAFENESADPDPYHSAATPAGNNNTDISNIDPNAIVGDLFSPTSMNMFTNAGESSVLENNRQADNKISANKKNNNGSSTAEINIPLNTSGAPDKNAQKNNEKKVAVVANNNDRSWQEDFAFRNKPKTNRFRQRTSIAYYVTPSFGYRGFFNNNEEKTAALRATGTEKLNDGAALNLEVGAALQYKISPSIRLKAGLQANYTNYVSKVTELQHPTQIALAVSNRTPEFRASEYSTKSGMARLNKTTFQIAMPIGADLKIAGKNRIKWYIGAAVQPTYVLSGSAYVLSSDAKNYVSETPLLRKWNMNAAVETFVSFRPASGVTLTVGPQFRYQLLSTYKKEYNYTEKLYNVGVKIGVATDF